MAKTLNHKLIVEHLLHGTFADNICLVCLAPLEINEYEDIFTLVIEKNKSYSIADILETLCQVTFQASDHYNVCLDCFTAASSAYKFYLTVKQSQQTLHYYTEALRKTDSINIKKTDPKLTLYIQLPIYSPDIKEFHLDYEGVRNKQCEDEIELQKSTNHKIIDSVKNEKTTYFQTKDGSSQSVENVENTEDETIEEESIENEIIVEENKIKRFPMVYINCPHCSLKYRFVRKLKEHMKTVHNINIYCCRICKKIFDTLKKYVEHKELSHPQQYQCDECKYVYDKKYKLRMHMKWHAPTAFSAVNDVQTDNAHICEVCGQLLNNEESLKQHNCSNLNKLQESFEAHKENNRHILNKNDEDNTSKKEQMETSNETENSVFNNILHGDDCLFGCMPARTSPTPLADGKETGKYTSKEKLRKCFVCGSSPAQDNVTLFRFPKPGKYNFLRCQSWAQFMFPERPDDWCSMKFLVQTHKEHKMLCQRHFIDKDFKHPLKRLLVPYAVPVIKDNEEISC